MHPLFRFFQVIAAGFGAICGMVGAGLVVNQVLGTDTIDVGSAMVFILAMGFGADRGVALLHHVIGALQKEGS